MYLEIQHMLLSGISAVHKKSVERLAGLCSGRKTVGFHLASVSVLNIIGHKTSQYHSDPTTV